MGAYHNETHWWCRGVGATGASQALALVDFQRYSENFISKKSITMDRNSISTDEKLSVAHALD